MLKKKYQFVTIGGTTRDFMFYDRQAKFLYTPEDVMRQRSLCFEYGSKIAVEETYITYGGGASNAAVNFALQGLKTAAIVSLGDDENGQGIINNFKSHGVDIRLIQKSAKKMTGFSFILTAGKEREHVIFAHRGANNNLHTSLASLKKFKTKWLYFTSLSCTAWRKALDNIFAVGSLVSWNPGALQLSAGAVGLKKYLERTNILALNEDEAMELVISIRKNKKVANSRLANIKFLLKELHNLGPNIVLVTRGRKGASAYDGEKYYTQKILDPKRNILDTTGVGDSFNSTFTAALDKYDGDIEKAMFAAVKNAASLTKKVGAQEGLIKVL